MRRPLCCIFLFYIAGIALEFFCRPPKLFYGLGLLVAVSIFLSNLYLERRQGLVLAPLRRLLCFLLAAFMAGGIYCGIRLDDVHPIELMAGETVEIIGTVVSMESKYVKSYSEQAEESDGAMNYHKMVVSLPKVSDNQKSGGRILLRVFGTGIKPEEFIGAEIRAIGEVSLAEGRRNPNCFDYRMYLKTINIHAIVSCDNGGVVMKDPGHYSLWGGFLNALARIKLSLLDRLEECMSEENVGLVAGMMFGDKTSIEEETYEAYQKNGTAHILSVSGLHVAIVYAFIIALLGNRKGPLQGTVAAVFLFVYMALAQFTPSVIRAAAMIFTHIAAMLLKKRYDLLTGACTAAGAMLIVNPLQLFHTGFQLSFLAIFSIAFAIPFFDRYIAPTGEYKSRINAVLRPYYGDTFLSKLGRIAGEFSLTEVLRSVLRVLLPLVVIQVGMAPYTAYVFNYVSFAAFILNIPVIFLAGFIIPIGTAITPLVSGADHLLGVFASLCGFVFAVGASALDILINIMNWLNDLGRGAAWGHMSAVSPPKTWLFCYYGLFFTLTSEYFRVLWQRRDRKGIMRVSALLVICVFFVHCIPGSGWDRSSLVFVDVGQGDCLHIRTPGGKNVLIDGGGNANYNLGKRTLTPYLLKNGVKQIDLALVTHLHTDHYKGLTELAQEYPVKKLAVYEGNVLRRDEIMSDTGMPAEDILFVYGGQRIELDKDVYIEILFPERAGMDVYEDVILNGEDENRSSLIMRLVYRGVSVLMTGDLGFEGEDYLLDKYGGRTASEGKEFDKGFDVEGLSGSEPDEARLDGGRGLGGREFDGSGLRCTMLKVGHHGSRFSTGDDFLRAVAPQAAIFQVGRNTYGHPNPDVVSKIENSGALVFRNDLSGAIMFDIDKDGNLSVETVCGT